MKLYLSSYRFGNHPEELTKLLSENKKAAIIMNAVDYGDVERKRLGFLNQIEKLNELGVEASELDLRDYFGRADQLAEYLKNFGLVWIHGGNAFILRRAFKQSGFDVAIKAAVENNQIVYAGFSAAVCLAAPTLHGVEIVDDPNIVPQAYEKEVTWDGLGLINHNVAVHYKSDHPESADTDKEVAYYKKNNIPYKTLSDGEVIIIDQTGERLLK